MLSGQLSSNHARVAVLNASDIVLPHSKFLVSAFLSVLNAMTENCFTRASVARQRIIDLVEMITCSIPAHPFNGYAQWLRAMVTRNGYPQWLPALIASAEPLQGL